ncbi:MAG: hypothetical protein JNL41_00750 [Phenylobacterium sp.]|uniref:hypothetical protein n=1 Tax=Phenylobacterium sp. TaxID=1871053 RepID=UPI001A3C491E|nr:hypothetical protein [Phenylobacterium sp.]MBL8552775.1 hypothetical protein [Phenylobacterium sp.]
MSRRVRIALLAAGAALALSACGTTRGKPRVLDIPAAPAPPPPAPAVTSPRPAPPPPAPVTRNCVPRTLPPAPRYPDTDAALRAAAGAADRYQLLAAGRILREKRLEQLEAVVASCR